jgi:hypothetical protein
MIGWTSINPVLLDVFREAALDATRPSQNFKAEWRDQPATFIDPSQRLALRLRITSVVGIGQDDTRIGEDDDGNVIETQTGQRKFTLQVQAIAPEQTDQGWALNAIERVRTRIRSRRTVDRLLELDVDVIGCGTALPVPFKDGGRVFSSGTMDVFFGCTASEDDAVPVGWIQYLVISSHVKDIDGTLLGAGQQMVNVEVPTIP